MKKIENKRNVVTSHNEPGFNYGYINSPFIQFDYARKATFLVYNGRLMPISFEDSNRIDDYWSLRKNAAMYPTGELPIEIKGADSEKLCDNIAIINNGEIIKTGETKSIINQFSNSTIEIELDSLNNLAFSKLELKEIDKFAKEEQINLWSASSKF